jgi:hypothetical protein
VPPSALKAREVVAWSLVALVPVVAILATQGARLDNDAYQYQSVARNLVHGLGASTDLPYFDVEIAHGILPAPVTTFPPGYPAAIALGLTLGIPPVLAAGLVSALGFVLAVPAIALACRALGLGVFASRAVLFSFIVNSHAVRAGRAAVTEGLFIGLVTAALALTLSVPRVQSRGRWIVPLAAGVALGLAYWVRYAGMLFVPGLAVIGVVRLYRERTGRALGDLALSLVGPIVLIGAGFYRNVALTGSWKGGNGKHVYHSVASILETTAKSLYDLVFALDGPRWTRAIDLALLVVVAWGLAPLLRTALGRLRAASWHEVPSDGLVALVAFVAFYFVVMIYLGVVSVIAFGTRMLLPLLPALLLLLALPIGQRRSLGRHPVIPIVVGAAYLLANVLSYDEVGPTPPHRIARADLEAPMQDGQGVGEWLLAHTRADEPLLASNGQGTSYALGRRVVSLTDSEYGERPWDEARVLETMARFHARYVVLYPHLDPHSGAVQAESSFLSTLLDGKVPEEFSLVATSASAEVFEREPAR